MLPRLVTQHRALKDFLFDGNEGNEGDEGFEGNEGNEGNEGDEGYEVEGTQRLSGGAVAAIVICCVSAVIFVAALAWLCARKRYTSQINSRDLKQAPAPTRSVRDLYRQRTTTGPDPEPVPVNPTKVVVQQDASVALPSGESDALHQGGTSDNDHREGSIPSRDLREMYRSQNLPGPPAQPVPVSVPSAQDPPPRRTPYMPTAKPVHHEKPVTYEKIDAAVVAKDALKAKPSNGLENTVSTKGESSWAKKARFWKDK